MYFSDKSNLSPVIFNPAGESVQELLGHRAGGVQNHSLAEITLPPGKSSAPHFHKATHESYLVLSGSATMQIDGEQFELQSGEAVLIEPMEVHQIANHGHEAFVFLAVCVPAWQPEDSFEANPAGQ